jgi:hypothetical protein
MTWPRRIIQAAAGGTFLSLCLASSSSLSADVVTRDDALAKMVPDEAFQGIGSWAKGDCWVATGHSVEVDSLGKGKGRRTEREFAEEEAKALILKQAAISKCPDYDEGSYDLKGEITGFQTAATYRISAKDGLYLVGVAKKSGVQVDVLFSAKKARLTAIALFEAGRYHDAAARFASLTQRGIQDIETMAYARAASWHVNLDSGIKGGPRLEALDGLGRFYLEQQDYEASLRNFYDLYVETDKPSRQFLDTLVLLCKKTERGETAVNFQNELGRRWPPPAVPQIKDATFDPIFEPVLRLQPFLLKSGGARLVKFNGSFYFVAVGTTDIRGTASSEKLRQLRVGRVQAQKEAIAFLEQTKVVAEETLTERTTVTTMDGKSRAEVLKTLDETTATKVHGVLNSLIDVGTWVSTDGTTFCFAIGNKFN